MEQKQKLSKYIKAILNNDVDYVIFYSDWCCYSMNAINLLKSKKVKFAGYIIDGLDKSMSELLDDFIKNKELLDFDVKHRTRPIIFKNGKFLGGYTELKKDLR